MTLSLFAALLERLREAAADVAAEVAPVVGAETSATRDSAPRPAVRPQSGLTVPAPGDTGRDPNARGRRLAYVDAAGWAAFGAFKAGITGRKGEGLVARALARLGVAALHDLVLADGQGGLVQIDHVARGPGTVVVIETKTYSGVITGELHGAAWTQHLAAGGGEARYRVPNAVRQNARHCAAVAQLLGEGSAPIRGVVVSAGTARFAGELAGAVIGVDGLGAALLAAAAGPADAATLDAAWRMLGAAAARSPALREAHLAAVRARREGGAARESEPGACHGAPGCTSSGYST